MAISIHIEKRVRDKKVDYTKYGLTRVQSNAFKAFLDLAQEFEVLDDVYQAAVGILKLFLGLDARIYVVDSQGQDMVLAATSESAEDRIGQIAPELISPSDQPRYVGSSIVLTIRGNTQLLEQAPLSRGDDVMGMLEVFPCGKLDRHQELFYQKYANRIGFSIHLRALLQKNIEHVKFIRTLVADIENNVIVPNMVYRLFVKRLRGKIEKNQEVERLLREIVHEQSSGAASSYGGGGAGVAALLEEISEINRGLLEEYGNIERHSENASLFLETLFRRSHFDEGHLTLCTTPCRMKADVIAPKLEQFLRRFEERGVRVVDEFGGESEQDTVSVMDVGLMAQVYSNLFSNVLKYAEAVDLNGELTKYMTFGRSQVMDAFGQGKHGIRYHVFSSGSHIQPDERGVLFEEGVRGSGAYPHPGSGHGLAFVKSAIELHGGVVGYEPVPHGNCFFFILPE